MTGQAENMVRTSKTWKRDTYKVPPRLNDAMSPLPVLGASVQLEQPLVLPRLLLGEVGVDVPHAERLPEVLEGEVGPHADGDLTTPREGEIRTRPKAKVSKHW